MVQWKVKEYVFVRDQAQETEIALNTAVKWPVEKYELNWHVWHVSVVLLPN